MTNQERLTRRWKSLHSYLVKVRGMEPRDANAEIQEGLQKLLPIERLGQGHGGTIKEQMEALKEIKKWHQTPENE